MRRQVRAEKQQRYGPRLFRANLNLRFHFLILAHMCAVTTNTDQPGCLFVAFAVELERLYPPEVGKRDHV